MNLDMDSKILEIKNTSEVTKWTIYRHVSPSGKIYVGITSKEINRRWRYGTGYSNCILFQNAIDKYGWDNIKHQVLFTNLTEDRAKNLEKDLIRHYKNLGVSYNITDGGDGHLGCSWTPTVYTRTIWSTQRKDRKLSEEHKKKISDTMKGRPMSKDVYIKGVTIVKTLLAKPVIQLSLSGEFIREFPSIKEAARSLNIKSDRDIIRCCKGERKSRAGYKWKYKDE
jgi:group I intron endonuclease